MSRRVGIIGGGQLGRMLALSAKNLDLYTVVLDPTPDSPAGQVADLQIVGDFRDKEKIQEVSGLVEVITFEIESANAEALEALVSLGFDINPSPKILSIIKDKYSQKKFLEKHDIPVAQSVEIIDLDDIKLTAKNFGYPFLLKARYDAYDGRGNVLIENESQITAAIKKLEGRALYAERFVPFVKELAVVVARAKNGEMVSYPVVETIHNNNICHFVLSPAPVGTEVAKRAEDMALQIISNFEGVGVFCVEMFLTANGEILVNEIAPRVHNAGHYSIEGHKTSQFEQHLRAITGMPLGDISRTSPTSVMVNILGDRQGAAQISGLEKAEVIPGAFVHLYGKTQTRVERKMGHITVTGDTIENALEKAKLVRSYISI